MSKVFLSYRHESDTKHPDHQLRVKQFGQGLRASGIEVILDQFYMEDHPGGPDEQWPAWCEARVPEADKVLMIASDGYFHSYNQTQPSGVGLGAACETTVIRNVLYYKDGYKTEKFRIGYFDKSHLKNLPDALMGLPRFDLLNADDISAATKWINGVPPHKVISASIDWPKSIQTYTPELANRSEEFHFFTRLISGSTAERGMLLEAQSNQGKTTILREFVKYARIVLTGTSCVVVDFKGNPTKEFALDTLRKKLGGLLPNFCRPNSAPLDLRTDLQSLATPTLLLFDTYEKASPEANEFIVGQLLPDLEDCAAVRIVIAGQSVPDHADAFWSPMVRRFAMGNITDPSHWSSYYKRLYGDPDDEQIKLLTTVTGGNPGVLRSYLQTVARLRLAK